MHERAIREDERKQATGVSRTRWWELERKNLAPARRRLTPDGRVVGWLASEIDDWLRNRPVGGPAAPKAAMAKRGIKTDDAA